MEIFITGVTGMGNRGVEALVTPIVHKLHGMYPNDRLVVLSRDFKEDARRASALPCEFVPDHYFLLRNRVARSTDAVRDLIPGRKGSIAQLNERIRSARAVVATGGDVFSSDYGGMPFHIEPLKQAIRSKVPVVMLAHSIGPFKSPEERRLWSDVASKSTLVTMRESLSYRYVTTDLGLNNDRCKLTADAAFLLEPPPARSVDQLSHYFGIDLDRSLICCAPSRGISRFSGLASSSAQNSQKHITAWTSVLEHLGRDPQRQIVLIPHVQDASTNNDVLFCSELIRAMHFPPSIKVVWGDLRASEFKGLISRADLVIAERMHAGIAGLSTATPTLLVKYSVKAEGVLRDLLGDEQSLQQAMVLFEDFLDPAKAIRSVQTAWDARSQLRAKLESALPRTRELAESNFRMMKELVP